MRDRFHDAVIVGAGQGGLSVSYFFFKAGVDHVLLDRGDIAQSWAAHRWDSFCLVTPNWSIKLPGRPYCGSDPDGFMERDAFVRYLRDWAVGFDAPVVGGIEVTRVRRRSDMFHVETSHGPFLARTVVIATATHQRPRVPPLRSQLPGHISQLHADNYKNCGQVEDGAVMVVGSGQTGGQIVEDLLRAGRKTILCVAQTGRLPRRYRGRDCVSWQRDLGHLDRTPDMLACPAQRFAGDPHLTGRDGGATVSLYDFHRRGVKLAGRLEGVSGAVASFRGDLSANLRFADEFAADFMNQVDEYVASDGGRAPRPTARETAGGPDRLQGEIRSPETLDLDSEGVCAVIWATGYSFDFGWIDGVRVDEFGYPVTNAGESNVPGLYFCGLNWMTRRKSGILYGVAEDARRVSNHSIARMTAASR